MFHGDELAKRYLQNEVLTEVELHEVARIAADYRERLMSISCFMAKLNEFVARKANKEENIKGKFWEPRFKSQALLDESALLACMAYVDLNPIRAGFCDTPENSDHTAIQTRIRKILGREDENKRLMPFSVSSQSTVPDSYLPFEERDYLELVDQTGRVIRQDKKGFIDGQLPPILTRLQLSQTHWLVEVQYFESRFKCMAGKWASIQKAAVVFKQRWFQGKFNSKQMN